MLMLMLMLLLFRNVLGPLFGHGVVFIFGEGAGAITRKWNLPQVARIMDRSLARG